MIVADKDQNMIPIIRSAVVKASMQEGAKEQARAQLREAFGPEPPLFEDGLVSSADGLSWSLFG